MIDGSVTHSENVNEGILDRFGSTSADMSDEIRSNLFDRNHFLSQIKSNHPEFLGPDVQITFYDS